VNPYYTEPGITIYHADCLDVLGTLPEVDMVFTSPPYNLGTTTGGGFGPGGKWDGGPLANGYTNHTDDMPTAAYEAWQREVLTACWGQLSDVGAIFYNHKPRVQDRTLWTPLDVNPNLPVRQIIIWTRGAGINFSPTHYLPTHEWIVIFAKPEWRLKSRGASGIGDVWYCTIDSDNEHPAPFPLGIPARAIETAAPRLVVDPFCGSGTTLRAAKDAGVPAIGIDNSEQYCEMAVNRLAQGSLFAFDQPDLFGT
jgi:DNA modification methylase